VGGTRGPATTAAKAVQAVECFGVLGNEMDYPPPPRGRKKGSPNFSTVASSPRDKKLGPEWLHCPQSPHLIGSGVADTPGAHRLSGEAAVEAAARSAMWFTVPRAGLRKRKKKERKRGRKPSKRRDCDMGHYLPPGVVLWGSLAPCVYKPPHKAQLMANCSSPNEPTSKILSACCFGG
jgi:hypothetical protein